VIALLAALVGGGAVLALTIGIASRPNALASLSAELGFEAQRRAERKNQGLYDILLHELALAGWPVDLNELFWLWIVACGVLTVVLIAVAHAGALGVLFGPGIVTGFGYAILRASQTRREAKVERQLIRALTTMTGLLTSAGTTIEAAVAETALRTPPPLGPELKRVAEVVAAGGHFAGALRDAGRRIGSKEWQFLVTAVTLQEERGGNLPRMLSKLTETLTLRVHDRGEARSLLAEAQMSKYFLAAATPGILGLLSLFDPKQVHQLFTTDLWMLGVATALWLMGVGVASWMTKRIAF
jgi:Flp pilus assembly protein TadB